MFEDGMFDDAVGEASEAHPRLPDGRVVSGEPRDLGVEQFREAADAAFGEGAVEGLRHLRVRVDVDIFVDDLFAVWRKARLRAEEIAAAVRKMLRVVFVVVVVVFGVVFVVV